MDSLRPSEFICCSFCLGKQNSAYKLGTRQTFTLAVALPCIPQSLETSALVSSHSKSRLNGLDFGSIESTNTTHTHTHTHTRDLLIFLGGLTTSFCFTTIYSLIFLFIWQIKTISNRHEWCGQNKSDVSSDLSEQYVYSRYWHVYFCDKIRIECVSFWRLFIGICRCVELIERPGFINSRKRYKKSMENKRRKIKNYERKRVKEEIKIVNKVDLFAIKTKLLLVVWIALKLSTKVVIKTKANSRQKEHQKESNQSTKPINLRWPA